MINRHSRLFGALICLILSINSTVAGDRAKLLPYINFYVEVLTQYWIKLLHVEDLTNVRIKSMVIMVRMVIMAIMVRMVNMVITFFI